MERGRHARMSARNCVLVGELRPLLGRAEVLIQNMALYAKGSQARDG